jgi:hypothetical protein
MTLGASRTALSKGRTVEFVVSASVPALLLLGASCARKAGAEGFWHGSRGKKHLATGFELGGEKPVQLVEPRAHVSRGGSHYRCGGGATRNGRTNDDAVMN